MTRKLVDWEAVAIQYRVGIRSLKDIGGEFGVSDAAIIKRAKRDGWTRDLRAKIQAKAEAKVSAVMVSAEVSAKTKATERQVIEANAAAIADIRLAHRRDIRRGRTVLMRLMDEMEQLVGLENALLLEELGEFLRRPDPNGQDKLNDHYRKIISLPSSAKTMKDLGEALRVLVGLERQAFGLTDGLDGSDGACGPGRTLSDAERAVRLSHLVNRNPNAFVAIAALAGGGKK